MLRNRIRRAVLGGTLAASLVVLLAFAGAADAQCGGAAWKADFSPPDAVMSAADRAINATDTVVDTIVSAGIFRGGQSWNMESFSPLELEPSATAKFQVVDGLGPFTPELGTSRRLLVQETTPALAPNDAGAEPFFVRREGAITATGWIDQAFCDLVMEGDVNTEGGRDGRGSSSRQGLMARWDKGNNFYWFYVNFVTGEYAIWRAKSLGEQITVPGSQGTVEGFDSTRPYRLRFELVGDTLRGQVFSYSSNGTLEKVGDTGEVKDSDPHLQGVSGFLAELAMERPFEPLEASFANLSARPLIDRDPREPFEPKVDTQRQQPVDPASYASLFEAASSFERCGIAQGALARYDEVLEVYPEHVPSLKGKAWLLATAEDSRLRDPSRSVDLAQQAFNLALQSNNTRHQKRMKTVYDRSYFVELAYVLAAGYAAEGDFQTVDDSLSGDTDSTSAALTVDWALTLARDIDAEQGSNYSRELVRYGEKALEAYRAQQALYGVELPGVASLSDAACTDLADGQETDGSPSRPVLAPGG